MHALVIDRPPAPTALRSLLRRARPALQNAGVEHRRVCLQRRLAHRAHEVLLVPPHVLHSRALSEDRLVAFRADPLHRAVEAILAHEPVVADAARLHVQLARARRALETVREMDKVLLPPEEELAMLQRRNNRRLARQALREIVLELVEALLAVREPVNGDEPLHRRVAVAAAHAREALGVEVAPERLDTFLRVDQLATFRAALAEAELVALLVEDEVVLRDALEPVERLAAEAAAEAVRVPVVPGECDLRFVDLSLAARADAGRGVRHVPEPARGIVRLDRHDVRKREELGRHAGADYAQKIATFCVDVMRG